MFGSANPSVSCHWCGYLIMPRPAKDWQMLSNALVDVLNRAFCQGESGMQNQLLTAIPSSPLSKAL